MSRQKIEPFTDAELRIWREIPYRLWKPSDIARLMETLDQANNALDIWTGNVSSKDRRY